MANSEPKTFTAQELPADHFLRQYGYTHEVRRGRFRLGLHRSAEAAEASARQANADKPIPFDLVA